MLQMFITIIVILIIIHIMVFFILSRIFVPFLGFKKVPFPKKLPKAIEKDIKRIKKASKTKKEFTEKAFYFLANRTKSLWLFTLIRVDILFIRNLEKIYSVKWFLPCTGHNHLLRIFLVKSGYYKDSQIEVRHCFLNLGMHQYLRVYDKDNRIVGLAEDKNGMPRKERLKGRNNKKDYFDLDLWAYTIGKPIGKHASFFKSEALLTDINEVATYYRMKRNKTR